MQTNADTDARSEPRTLFEKLLNLEEGDTFEILGEQLRLEYTSVSAAHKELFVYGRHEDATELAPRYEIVLDARYDSFEIFERETSD